MNQKQCNLLNKTIRVIKSCETTAQLAIARSYVGIFLQTIPWHDRLKLRMEIDELLMLKQNSITEKKV